MAGTEPEQATTELPVVEGGPSVVRDGAQRAGDAGQAHALADLERSGGAELARARERMDEVAGQGQHDGGGEAVVRQLDGRPEDLVERQAAMAAVEREPAVHGAGHRHAPDVPAQGHHRHPLGAHPRRVGSGTGAPDRQERLGWRAGRGDHGEDVAAQAAQVGADDRHHGTRGHGGIGRRAAAGQHAQARRGGQLVGRRHHAAQPCPGAEGREREGHGTLRARRRRPSAAPRRAPCARRRPRPGRSRWSR